MLTTVNYPLQEHLLTKALINVRLTENNQFKCDCCKTTSDASQVSLFLTTPNILLIQLKRLDYNEKLQEHIKLEDRYKNNLKIHINLIHTVIYKIFVIKTTYYKVIFSTFFNFIIFF